MARITKTTLASTVAAALTRAAADGALEPSSMERLTAVTDRFVAFLEATGVRALQDVDVDCARAFVAASTRARFGLHSPSVATMHLRRTALRLLFRGARTLGYVDGDPTLDLRLPPRTRMAVRALSDEEVALCRGASLRTLTWTRHAAAWALAETTARPSELPFITRADLDLDACRVWLHGGSTTLPRWGQLTSWGAQQLPRHVRQLPDTQQGELSLLCDQGKSVHSQRTLCWSLLNDTLIRAGLHDAPDVQPASVAVWAAQRALAERGRIDDAARALGVRSLDRAATFIGWRWDPDGSGDEPAAA